MVIKCTTNDTETTVRVEGRLDTTTAPELESVLKDAGEKSDSLVLDFEELDYLSSAGLRVLLSAQKMMMQKKGMKVIHVNETVWEILEVTGFSDVLTIEKS
ncbi:MAG: STAS domain-containing protein [Solobacterium sp.]|nr:STAS domain-containing protein [Solobacterium sp.]